MGILQRHEEREVVQPVVVFMTEAIKCGVLLPSRVVVKGTGSAPQNLELEGDHGAKVHPIRGEIRHPGQVRGVDVSLLY